MRSTFAIVLLLLTSFSAAAQSSDREKAIGSFGKDLAAIQAKILVANAQGSRLAAGGAWEEVAMLNNDAVVRSEPSDASAAVATFPEGSQVRVVERTDDWARVSLSKDGSRAKVGWVSTSAIGMAMPPRYASYADDLLDTVVQEAKGLVDRYRGNPWIKISGFSTEVGMTGVSLSVQFELK